MRLLALSPLVFALAFAAPATPARAEDSPVKGLRIVVPDARGKGDDGRAALAKSVRRTLAEGVGPLIPSQKLAGAQKKLKQKGKQLFDPAALAEAARKIDAQYVLAIEITREKWLFTAHAVLINVETGEAQMDFRSQYFKPKSEADDRGKRIGARTLLKLEDLLKAGPPPFAGGAAVASKTGGKGEDTKIDRGEPKDSTLASRSGDRGDRGDRGMGGGDRSGSSGSRSGMSGSGSSGSGASGSGASGSGSSGSGYSGSGSGSGSGSSGSESSGSGASGSGYSGSGSGSGSSGSGYSGSGSGSGSGSSGGGSSYASSGSGGSAYSGGGSSTSAGVEIAPTGLERPRESFRATITGGAGILHTYDLSSADISSSRLSYRLEPLAMIGGDAEFVLPGIPIGILARASYRPVKFQVTVQNAMPGDTANTPSGFFLDTQGLLRFHIGFAGHGRNTYKLIPGAGVALGLIKVARHPGDPILSSTSFSPIGSVAVRMPFNDVLELNIGADGGLVLGYSESPANTGASKSSGFTFGADLQARIWLSSAIAIAFDTRFDFQHVSFKGAPTRIQAPNEDLENASTSTKDLRTGIGIALRL